MALPFITATSFDIKDDMVDSSVPYLDEDTTLWEAGQYEADAKVVFESYVYQRSGVTEGFDANRPPPEMGEDYWVRIAPTNRWALLDGFSLRKTEAGSFAWYEFELGRAVKFFGLVNYYNVEKVRIQVIDEAHSPDDPVVYDKTIAIGALPARSSWYAWLFEPRSTVKRPAYAADIPTYPFAKVRIEFTGKDDMQLGKLILGDVRAWGYGVQMGADISFHNFSATGFDKYGLLKFKEGANSPRANFSVFIHKHEVDSLFELMERNSNRPVLFVGSDYYKTLTIYGWSPKFEIAIEYADYSMATFNLEGISR